MNCEDVDEDAGELYSNLKHLPPPITANILSFIPWQEKIQFVTEILPEWRTGLYSTGAWTHFHIPHFMRRGGESDHEHELRECITEYGKYIQHLTVALVAFNYNLDDVNIQLLEHIAKCCRSLRTFRVDHPSSVRFYMQDVLHRYAKLLHDIAEVNCYLRSVALCDITYMPFDRALGMNEFLSTFLPYDKLTNCVTKLELCDFYDYSQPYESLCRFTNLKILKILVEVLNTDVILGMCAMSLEHLYIVNSGSAINEEFRESERIDWAAVAKKNPHLRVHYIYQERTIKTDDIVANELVQSVVLDSLCNPVNSEIMLTIISNQGKNLQTFAHLDTYWDYNAYGEDFDYVGCFSFMSRSCERLKAFISTVRMSCQALMEMAESTAFERVLVVAEQLFLDFDYCCSEDLNMKYFQRFMRDSVGSGWECASQKDVRSKVRFLYKL
ncbi:uncharacterized protein LOC141906190 [Tubulanus polymorphus]|uniref:uncharacterized protein LOC141906190 n=1 Tax=Tubulanus polymorphus TaxID=672921 RepID=UPI003DA6AF3F